MILERESSSVGQVLPPRKVKVLVLASYYLPGCKGGGPGRSILNLVNALSSEMEFHIITSDRDLGDSCAYKSVAVDQWNSVGKAKVFYASPAMQHFLSLARLIAGTPHDVIYLNSYFSARFTIGPLMARRVGLISETPTIIAPRGEFSEGALQIKNVKKQIFMRFANIIRLYDGLLWQASSVFEFKDIERALRFGGKPVVNHIVIAADVPAPLASAVLPARVGVGEPLRVCFLSRISPMKNLDFALRVLASVDVPLSFDIYGSEEDKLYWSNCRQLISKMPERIIVRYHGEIAHDRVIKELRKFDLFFLPTRGENFGHVIHEALSAGLPVLISDRTPWRHLQEAGVGWDLPLDRPDQFKAALESQYGKSLKERTLESQRAIQYAVRMSTDQRILTANRLMFVGMHYLSRPLYQNV